MSKWIDANLEKPEDAGDDVLAVVFGKMKNVRLEGSIEFAYFEDGQWYLIDFQDDDGWDIPVKVTHWMPVPDPPEVDA